MTLVFIKHLEIGIQVVRLSRDASFFAILTHFSHLSHPTPAPPLRFRTLSHVTASTVGLMRTGLASHRSACLRDEMICTRATLSPEMDGVIRRSSARHLTWLVNQPS